MADFYAVMSEEMIALTGQRDRVEAVVGHIVGVTKLIENVDFDPFHVDNARLWSAVMVTFWQEVSIIEFDIRKFIDDVFKTVRSAEVAFDTVLTFRHISTRESVGAVMKTKFGEVLQQYDKQVCVKQSINQSTRDLWGAAIRLVQERQQ